MNNSGFGFDAFQLFKVFVCHDGRTPETSHSSDEWEWKQRERDIRLITQHHHKYLAIIKHPPLNEHQEKTKRKKMTQGLQDKREV